MEGGCLMKDPAAEGGEKFQVEIFPDGTFVVVRD